jgi:hypothetical protein
MTTMDTTDTFDPGREGMPPHVQTTDEQTTPDWTGNPSVLIIHAGLSGIHRDLGALGGGAFGPLDRAQKDEVERLEDTSHGILDELEGLVELEDDRQGNGAAPGTRSPRRGSAVGLGLSALLYEIERDKKSGILRVEDNGDVEAFHLAGGEFGYAVAGVSAEASESGIRRDAIQRIDRSMASRTASFEFTETAHSPRVQSLGLDTIRLVLDGIRRHYSTAELEDALGDPEAWRMRPGAMRTIANLPLSADEMSIARLLGAGWTAVELSAETRLEGRVVPLAAALHAFGLFGASFDGEGTTPASGTDIH